MDEKIMILGVLILLGGVMMALFIAPQTVPNPEYQEWLRAKAYSEAYGSVQNYWSGQNYTIPSPSPLPPKPPETITIYNFPLLSTGAIIALIGIVTIIIGLKTKKEAV